MLKAMSPKKTPIKTTSAGNPRLQRRQDSLLYTPPDGGYGWVIVATCFFVQCISTGFVFSVGVYFTDWIDAFQQPVTLTAWIGSLNFGLFALASPLSSILINKFGYRAVTILGSCMAAVGCLGSAWGTNIYHLYISYGVIAGLGFSFSYIPAVVIIGFYFRKRRALALGLSASGVGFGNLIFPAILRALIKYYGWRGAMVISSGICLNMCIFAMFMLPVEYWTKFQNPNATGGFGFGLKSIFNYTLFKEGKFWVFLLNNIMWNFAAIFLIMTPDFAKDLGFGKDKGALLVSIAGGCNAAGRLTAAFIASHPRINRLAIYIITTGIRGLAVVLFPLYTHYYYAVFCSIMYGIGFGLQLGVYAIVTAELFGMRRFTSAYGYAFCGVGFGGLLAPPVGGWIKDVNGAYSGAFYFGGCVTIAGAVLMLVVPIFDCCARKGWIHEAHHYPHIDHPRSIRRHKKKEIEFTPKEDGLAELETAEQPLKTNNEEITHPTDGSSRDPEEKQALSQSQENI